MQACGKCLHCRVNKKTEWTSRLLLEARSHPCVQFVTLTYNDEHLPEGNNLSPRDVQLFLKRLRVNHARAGGAPFRFFLCAEYGLRTGRAHYHLILYGRGVAPGLVDQSWGLGFVKVEVAGAASLSYVSGYVVKKYLNQSDYVGKVKPFIRCSNRPGIGARAVGELAAMVRSEHLEFGDVPRGWIHEGKQRPLGRCVRTHLRKELFAGRADDVREASGEQLTRALYLALKYSQPEVDRMVVESEKAAQLGLRVLDQLRIGDSL